MSNGQQELDKKFNKEIREACDIYYNNLNLCYKMNTLNQNACKRELQLFKYCTIQFEVEFRQRYPGWSTCIYYD